MRLQPPLLWTTLRDEVDGVVLAVRGELSSITAPALSSLLDALADGHERLTSLDLRDAVVLLPAGERLLTRWSAVPDVTPGTYRLDALALEAGD
jgi:hypothetical protein